MDGLNVPWYKNIKLIDMFLVVAVEIYKILCASSSTKMINHSNCGCGSERLQKEIEIIIQTKHNIICSFDETTTTDGRMEWVLRSQHYAQSASVTVFPNYYIVCF